MSTNKQKQYFDQLLNQYSSNLIFQRPAHVELETKEIVKRLQKQQSKKMNIVDFGAGTGRLTIPLLEQGYKVMAVDISHNSLNKLIQNSKKIGKRENLQVSTKIKKNNVKAVLGCDILHHINLDLSFKKIYRQLATDGFIIFSEPNALNLAWYVLFFFSHNWEFEKGILSCNHFVLSRSLKAAGFTSIKISGLGLFPLPLFNFFQPFAKLNLLLANLPILKYFAYRLIIQAKKSTI